MGKELDDICTSCPYIDAVKRHKQQLGAIEEYTQWLKKEPRASYFFLFQLYTRIHNTFFSQKQQLPFTPGGTHCPEPDVTLRDLTLSPGYHSDYAPQPIPEMDSSAVVPPTNENTSPPDKIYREIIWFCSSYLLKSGPEATRTIINSVFSEWASINNDYPSPFSWVDSRDSEQCDWLWNAMQVRCVGTPLNPLTPEQKYWFACATFDNWEGWNEQQVQFLLESNPRRNRAKFTQVSFQAPRIQHKAILLDELKSAREQQKRRDERADGSVPLKLSGKIHKQLESIARSRGVLPKKLLNEMIEQAYHDLVATRQNSQIDSR
ncbi:hypothetical protein RHQ77_002792 [Escherichia coli]|nr:hypothetical protein [Escherichia coli]